MVHAQAVTETVVSKNSTLIIDAIDRRNIGSLAEAANVPFGFEGVAASPQKHSIRTAGRRLREVLDEMVAADPRYEWRDVDGVVVFRLTRYWSDDRSPLLSRVAGLSLRNVDASDAIKAVSRLLGQDVNGWVSDTRVFSVEVPQGSTLLESLNAITRAHGSMAWMITPTEVPDPNWATISLSSGSGSMGFGVRVGATVTSRRIVIERPEKGNDNGRLVLWDRIVPVSSNGLPITASAISSGVVEKLANAVRAPMGIESLPTVTLPDDAPSPEETPLVTLTGMTLWNALGALIALDPRYQWRDMDGVIVFRPLAAWSDRRNPLLRGVEAFRFTDATLFDVLKAFNARLGITTPVNLSDARRFAIDSPAGSVLEALNTIVRSHGDLHWHWEAADEEERARTRMTSRLTFTSTSGPGFGYLVP